MLPIILLFPERFEQCNREKVKCVVKSNMSSHHLVGRRGRAMAVLIWLQSLENVTDVTGFQPDYVHLACKVKSFEEFLKSPRAPPERFWLSCSGVESGPWCLLKHLGWESLLSIGGGVQGSRDKSLCLTRLDLVGTERWHHSGLYLLYGNNCPLFYSHWLVCVCTCTRTSLTQTCKFLLLKPFKKGHLFIKMTLLLSEVTSKCVVYGTQVWEWFSLFNQLLPQPGAIEAIKLYFRYIAPDYNEVCQNECLAGVSGFCLELFIFIYSLRLIRTIWFPGLWFKWVFKIFLCKAALESQASGSSRESIGQWKFMWFPGYG